MTPWEYSIQLLTLMTADTSLEIPVDPNKRGPKSKNRYPYVYFMGGNYVAFGDLEGTKKPTLYRGPSIEDAHKARVTYEQNITIQNLVKAAP